MLFSATLDAAIDVLVRRFLDNPATHSVNENSSPAEIEHHVLTIDPAKKLEVLAALVGGDKRSLVFTRTKHGAERIARQLTELGIPAAELHGNLRQGARARNLAAFSNGIARVMVATDIAARGIHVDGIDLVIHADPPAEHKAYVHRSGRTARGGADGVVVTLQMRSQAREVTAMMRKADITPQTAAAYDPQSDVLREIGGPPAPRVKVSGKVSELVRPEDRLAANAGRPGGRGGYGRGGSGRSRDDRPRGDRRDYAPRDGDRGFDRGPRPERDRYERSSGERSYGERSSGERSYGDRSFDSNRAPRGEESRRDGRPYGGRPSGSVRTYGGDRAAAPGRPFRGNRDDQNSGRPRPERNDWYPRENRPASGNGASGEYRRPGAAGGWRPAGVSSANRSAGGYRPVRDSRNGDSGGENRDGSGRGDRPSATGRPGATRARSGYSTGRNGTR
jgi:superfamily II DNA/RNA helicase